MPTLHRVLLYQTLQARVYYRHHRRMGSDVTLVGIGPHNWLGMFLTPRVTHPMGTVPDAYVDELFTQGDSH